MTYYNRKKKGKRLDLQIFKEFLFSMSCVNGGNSKEFKFLSTHTMMTYHDKLRGQPCKLNNEPPGDPLRFS